MLQTLEKQKGIEVLKEACTACGEAILAQKGRMVVKDEARVVRIVLLCASCLQPLFSIMPCNGRFSDRSVFKNDAGNLLQTCCGMP